MARDAAVSIRCSPQLPDWLASQQISLAVTTYQAGKLLLIGRQPGGGLSVAAQSLPRCMGLAADGQSLYVSTQDAVWRFENILEPGQSRAGHDRVYAPQVASITGDIDVHDLALDTDGQPRFVTTLFNCLATLSERRSFVPFWKPPFVSDIVAEDRCHLNGLAMYKGRPAWATCVAETDDADAWREHRHDGGCLINIETDEVAVRGLSMPHSPRLHRDEIWLLNSGTGEFGRVDPEQSAFEPHYQCPGYPRGLCFVGDHAVVGISKPRDGTSFSGLAIEQRMRDANIDPICGLQIVDMQTGKLAHELHFGEGITELYDVVALAGVAMPTAIGLQSDDVRRVISIEAPIGPCRDLKVETPVHRRPKQNRP